MPAVDPREIEKGKSIVISTLNELESRYGFTFQCEGWVQNQACEWILNVRFREGDTGRFLFDETDLRFASKSRLRRRKIVSLLNAYIQRMVRTEKL